MPETETSMTDDPAGSAARPAPTSTEGTEKIEVVDDSVGPQTESEGETGDSDREPMITEPAKLMRIAVMLREVQEEARRADADPGGRDRLRQVHDRAISELSEILSEDLQAELAQFTFALGEDTPSQSEIMIAQAQLIGWLEGLFQGIQAALFNQQAAARQQLETMRQRQIGSGGGGVPGRDRGHDAPGQYL